MKENRRRRGEFYTLFIVIVKSSFEIIILDRTILLINLFMWKGEWDTENITVSQITQNIEALLFEDGRVILTASECDFQKLKIY